MTGLLARISFVLLGVHVMTLPFGPNFEAAGCRRFLGWEDSLVVFDSEPVSLDKAYVDTDGAISQSIAS